VPCGGELVVDPLRVNFVGLVLAGQVIVDGITPYCS